MIDPASLRNWIDPPDSIPPLPFAANDPPNEIDKALDTLAEAIRQAEHGERNSMASYLMRLPVRLPDRENPGATPVVATYGLPRAP